MINCYTEATFYCSSDTLKDILAAMEVAGIPKHDFKLETFMRFERPLIDSIDKRGEYEILRTL